VYEGLDARVLEAPFQPLHLADAEVQRFRCRRIANPPG
jgi:hypothetical protein